MYETIEEYFTNFKKLPSNPNKINWEKVFNDMSVHTRKRIPKESLLARRPNEEEETLQYRISNYRAITYGSMNKALDDTYRIINGISYTINAPDNVKEYLNTKSVTGYSNVSQNEICNLSLFLQKVVLKRMIEDPNGFLIWLPSGEGMVDSSTKVIPEPTLVECEDYFFADKNIFIWESEEHSPLKNSNGDIEMVGEIYYALSKEDYYKFYQDGTISDPIWKLEKIYNHKLGDFPIIILGGEMNAEGFYESYFAPYLAFGDEAIHQFSDWQAVMTTSSFPKTEEFMTECVFDTYTQNSSNTSESEEEFQGKGTKGKMTLRPIQKSPYGKILRKVPNSNIGSDDLPVDVPSVRYISPDIAIAKYSGESWEKLIEKAEKALNIDINVGVSQSGVAKQLDKESQYSMITKIGMNVYDNIYTNSLRIIEAYLNNKKIKSATSSINKPSTFWVKNELDLINEISTLKTSNAPSFFLAEATNDLAKKRFNGNPVNQKLFDFIALYDPYFIYTTAEKGSMLASSVMTKEEYIASIRMYGLLNQIVLEVTPVKFLDMPMGEIYDKFDTLLQDFIPEAPKAQYDAQGNLIP